MVDLPEPDEPTFTPWAEHASPFTTPSKGRVVLRRAVLAHPFRFNGSGDVAVVYDTEAVAVEIRTVLGTFASTPNSRGEIEWDPERGSVIDRLRHMADDVATRELVKFYVLDALSKYVPAVVLRSATIDTRQHDSGVALVISLVYDIPAIAVQNVTQVIET